MLLKHELQIGLFAVKLPNLLLERAALLVGGFFYIDELLVQGIAFPDHSLIFGLEWLLLNHYYAQNTYISAFGADLRLEAVVQLLQFVESLGRLQVVVEQFLD